MGRKSSRKKVVREIVKEEESKKKGLFENKKSKKEIKEEALKKTAKVKKTKKPDKKAKKKKRTALKNYIKPHKKKIFGGGLALIMLAILISVGYLLFQKAIRPMPIAKILPEKNTVVILEINSNFAHSQVEDALSLAKDYEDYSKEALIKDIEDKYKVNFEQEVAPWLGRGIGMAMLNSQREEKAINTIHFAEVLNKTAIKTLLESRTTDTTYLGHSVYISPNGFTFTFISDYLIISEKESAIQELIDFQSSNEERLYASSKYSRIDDNLPINKVGFFYINFKNITPTAFKYVPILSEQGISAETITPFLNLFDSEGMALIALEDKFAVQSFLSLDKEKVKNSQYLDVKHKYQANLSNYVSSDAIAFWGGEDVESQIKRLLESLAGGASGTLTAFDKLLDNYGHKYFGQTVDFEKEILPLLNSEFAIAIEDLGGKAIYKILLSLEDSKVDALKIHELADNFAKVGAVFEPQVVEVILEDGTVAREIVAVSEQIVKTESKHKGHTIFHMKLGHSNQAVSYAFLDDVAVIASDPQGIINAIDFSEGEGESLNKSGVFDNLISPILQSSDEIAYFNFEKLIPIYFSGTGFTEKLSPINYLSSGKNYFNDGISTINYLQLK